MIRNVLYDTSFQDAHSFSDGLALVKTKGKYGYINKSGQYIIHPQFEKAKSFFRGLARVFINKKWYYINKKKQIVWPKDSSVVARHN